jgi:hypothetical protein
MLCPLQRCYQTLQRFRVKAPPNLNPAPASTNDRQLGRIAAFRRHLDSNPLGHRLLTTLLAPISG